MTDVSNKTENLTETLAYLEERASNINAYSDKLRESLITISDFMPKTGVEVIGDALLGHSEYAEELTWRYRDGKLWVTTFESDILGNPKLEYKIEHAPRSVLMEGVKELPHFLKKVAEKLADFEGKIGELSSIASAMAKLVKEREQ